MYSDKTCLSMYNIQMNLTLIPIIMLKYKDQLQSQSAPTKLQADLVIFSVFLTIQTSLTWKLKQSVGLNEYDH